MNLDCPDNTARHIMFIALAYSFSSLALLQKPVLESLTLKNGLFLLAFTIS